MTWDILFLLYGNGNQRTCDQAQVLSLTTLLIFVVGLGCAGTFYTHLSACTPTHLYASTHACLYGVRLYVFVAQGLKRPVGFCLILSAFLLSVMSWLHTLAEQGASRAKVVQERHATHGVLSELQAANLWIQSEDLDIGNAPAFLKLCWGTPAQNTLHARLSQAWCVIQKHRGCVPGEALKQFNATLWPQLKKTNPKLKPDHQQFHVFFKDILRGWLADSVDNATDFLAQTAQPAAAPVAVPAVSAGGIDLLDQQPLLSLLFAPPAALHSDDSQHILSFLEMAPESKGNVLQSLRELDTFG